MSSTDAIPPDATPAPPATSTPVALLCVALLGTLVLAQLWVHVLWLDEAQAWLIASTARSLPELLHNLRYEGHPGLWHLLLFAVSRVGHSPLLMQGVSAVCTLGFLALLFLRAPFSTLEKLLLASGYFVLFEYAAFARSYGLGMLLCAMSAASLARRDGRGAWGVWLGLLANTTFFGALIAGTLVVERVLARREPARALLKQLTPFVLLSALAVWVMAPASDVNVQERGQRALELLPLFGTGRVIARAWVAPVPPWDPHFWTLLQPTPYLVVALLFVAMLWALGRPLRRPLLLLAVWAATALFGWFVYGVFVRHVGTLWLLTLALLWGARAERPRPTRLQRAALAAVILAHVVGACVAIPQHWRAPMSRSRDIAQWIAANVDAGTPLVGEDDRAMVAVSAYLDGRPITPLCCMEPRTFILWNLDRHEVPEDFVKANAAPLHQDFRDALLLLSRDHGNRFTPVPDVTLVRVASFPAGVIEAEQAWLYVFADGALAPRLTGPR